MLTWRDDFEDGVLDPDRWDVSASDDLVYERDGVLNFVVPPPPEYIERSLPARPPTTSIEDASVTVTLLTEGSSAPGGVGLRAILQDGAAWSVDLGPGSGDPGTDIRICDEPDQCEEPPSPDFPEVKPSKPVVLRIARSGSTTAVYVDDDPYYQAETGPIRMVELYFYADNRSTYHATADDFTLHYRS